MIALRTKLAAALAAADAYEVRTCQTLLRDALDMIDHGEPDLAASDTCANCGCSTSDGGCNGLFAGDGDVCELNRAP